MLVQICHQLCCGQKSSIYFQNIRLSCVYLEMFLNYSHTTEPTALKLLAFFTDSILSIGIHCMFPKHAGKSKERQLAKLDPSTIINMELYDLQFIHR
jgi:hypothetical protein